MPKSKYNTHVEPNLKLITSWREAGKTERQIAEKLKIAYSTFQSYKDGHPDLVGALDTSKEKLIANLKKSLWQEAIGYEYEEVEQLIEETPVRNPKYDKNKEDGPDNMPYIQRKKSKVRKVKKKARGVPTLLIFALCNLCPQEFQRIDKEAVDELKNEVDKIVGVHEEKLDKMLNVMYGKAIKEKESVKDDNKCK